MAPQFDRPLRDLLRAAGCTLVRQGKGSHEIWYSPITRSNFPVPIGIPSRHTAAPSFGKPAYRRHSSGRRPPHGRSFTLAWGELKEWVGERAQSGSSAPRGFPKSNSFGPVF